MKRLFTPALCLSVLLSTGCASSYHAIHPEAVNYHYSEISPDALISTGYVYDVMTLRNNKKYVKKEVKSGIKVVSVKLVNNSSEPMHVGSDCTFMMGNREIIPVDGTLAANQLKQGVPIYLLYSLLTLTITKPGNYGESETTSIPIGLPIAGGNMIVAGTANKLMRQELTGNNILNKIIEPGATAYGLLCLREQTTGPIKVVFNN